MCYMHGNYNVPYCSSCFDEMTFKLNTISHEAQEKDHYFKRMKDDIMNQKKIIGDLEDKANYNKLLLDRITNARYIEMPLNPSEIPSFIRKHDICANVLIKPGGCVYASCKKQHYGQLYKKYYGYCFEEFTSGECKKNYCNLKHVRPMYNPEKPEPIKTQKDYVPLEKPIQKQPMKVFSESDIVKILKYIETGSTV